MKNNENFSINRENKDKMLGIFDLDITYSFINSLLFFVNEFPKAQDNLVAAFEAKDSNLSLKHFESICKMLEKIHADKLLEKYRGYVIVLETSQPDITDPYIKELLNGAALLSLDIQRALYSPELEYTELAENLFEENYKKPDTEQLCILAVDDVSFFLNRLKMILQDSPYKLICANSGKVALDFISRRRPSLFLLDIEMPEMNGYDLAREIRKAGHTAPILFLTGNASPKYVTKAIEAGASDFILKSIDQNQIIEKIDKYIKQ